MINRIETIRNYIECIFNDCPSIEESRIAYLHTYSVASICSMIAGKRGLNNEIAFIIGLLHDIYSYRTGIHENHSHRSAEMVRPVLRDMGIFSDEEMEIIVSAIFHHSDKQCVHDVYDELIKDADLLQHFLVDPAYKANDPVIIKRLENLIQEFGLSTRHPGD